MFRLNETWLRAIGLIVTTEIIDPKYQCHNIDAHGTGNLRNPAGFVSADDCLL